MTALEDPITDNAPAISIDGGSFTIDVATALNTVAITPVSESTDLTKAKRVDKVGVMHEVTILPD